MGSFQFASRAGSVLAVSVVSLALAGSSATADPGISVTVRGTTVQVSTTACPKGGNASLIRYPQANFAQGRQAQLTVDSLRQSASWNNVKQGRYTVIVVCNGGTTAGTKSFTVGPR
ncbi:hypothetical protein [Streptomyces syringium]|uniref:hypothetical protein n=1 Tax=Streptomyces syringium TaxID=76729 RepID=UPI0034549886